MFDQLRSFLRDVRGNATMILGVCALPIFVTIGSAVDYMRYNNTKTEIQAAIDGAALAAALPIDATDEERVAIAKDYFESNLAGLSIETPDLQITISDDTISASVKTTMPAALMLVAGIKQMSISENTEVMRPFAGQAEVVLVLDYSLSMNDSNKYLRMQRAATRMIDDLDAAIPAGKLKMGLVPFSGMVYTSMDADYVTQSAGGSTWTGCTQDRAYPNNTNVDTPTSDSDTKWGYFDNTSQNKGSFACSSYQSKGLKIIPLTSDMASMKTKLAAMQPLGYTNIALGAEFGWNLLDPVLPYDEALPYDGNKNRKFLILLTDGVQTSNQWGDRGSRNVNNAGPNLLSLCQGMRDQRVTVFTIAYDVTDPDVTTLLSDCAPGHYYEPSVSGAEINAVFSQITKQIQNRTVRLSR